MRSGRAVIRPDRAGLLLCSLLAATAMGWLAGWAWLAAPAALAVLGVSACAVGADSRAPGDWGNLDRR